MTTEKLQEILQSDEPLKLDEVKEIIYERGMSSYRINKTGRQKWVKGEGWKWINTDDYDIIVERVGSGYATAYYEILKNSPGLSPEELAHICDPCNFGYRVEANKLVIYTD